MRVRSIGFVHGRFVQFGLYPGTDAFPHAMIVPLVIAVPKAFHKLQQVPSTHAVLQVHKGIVATGPTVVGLQGLVATHHLLPMPRDPLVKSRSLVDGQRQPVTVHQFTHPLFRPHPQPMLASFAGRVRVDDIGASGGLGRVLGQSIGGIDALEHALQLGVRKSQCSQLTIA